jgi:hypothetical protein
MIDFSGINWLAVLAAGVASFILGGIWYSFLLSKPWMRLTGIDPDKDERTGAAHMALLFGGALVTYLIAAAFLAALMAMTGVTSAGTGALFGLLVGVGFVATITFNTYRFAGKPFALFLIDVGYPVLALGLSGLILGAW